MKHELPPLPYREDALAPRMSMETLQYHHGKHQQTYVNNLNDLIVGTLFEEMPLEEIVRKAEGPIFNNAAQDWNHTCFFYSLAPEGKHHPEGSLAEAIRRDFGAFDIFKERFTKAATSLFGSGWVWLAADKAGNLHILPESNAGNPMRQGLTPLLVIDVWEHAYYIDYKNRRAEYIAAFWDLIDWNVIEERFNRLA